MSLRDVNARHLKLIGSYSTRYAIRAGSGLIFVLLVMIAGLLIGLLLVAGTVEQVEKQAKERGATAADAKREFEARVRAVEPAIAWVLGEGDLPDPMAGPQERKPWARYLLEEKPALLSGILLILMFVLPYLTVIGSFNQYSGDISSRGVRYQLLRTERANIYFGRLLGTALFGSFTLAILLATTVGYLALALDYYSFGALCTWGFRGWIALSILYIPYAALSGAISGSLSSPFGSLVLCLLAIAGPLVGSIFSKAMDVKAGVYLKWLVPWGLQNQLLHYSLGSVALAALACLGYAAAYAGLGYYNFSKRDL